MNWQISPLVTGNATGHPLILDEPLSLWGGLDPHTGNIIDQRHPQCGQNVRGKVLILPSGRGSSSASSILMEAIRNQQAPSAIIMAVADGILALGSVVARELYTTAPPVAVLPQPAYDDLCHHLATLDNPMLTITENQLALVL